MYLIETNLFKLAKKQYLFKLKTNFGLFFSLMLVQIFAIFISLGGVGSATGGGPGLDINITFVSGNIAFVFTLIWAFTISTIVTNIKNKNIDFTFVSNRFTSNFSNIGLLITLSLYGGLTAALSSNLIKILFYYISDNQNVINSGLLASPQYILINIISTIFYIILISSIGYFLGSLVQLNKIFILLCSAALPFVIILGLKLFSPNMNSTFIDFIKNLINFYISESSLFIFTVKILITASVFFSGAVLLSNRMEVKKC